jgi:hypothetical protein
VQRWIHKHFCRSTVRRTGSKEQQSLH